MWIFTLDGFYSVATNRFCQSDEVVVRSREKEDFKRLGKKIHIPTILENKKEDYRYYIILKRSILASYLSGSVFDVNYGDFKEKVAIVDKNQQRQIAYLNAWFSLKNAFERKWNVSRETLKSDLDLCRPLEIPDEIVAILPSERIQNEIESLLTHLPDRLQ